MNHAIDEILRRRELSADRLTQLQQQLAESSALLEAKACVYVSGSFGRAEASKHSDLDLFIVGKCDVDEKNERKPLLSKLDEVLVKADLIKAARDLNFPDFDREGEFIKQHLINDLVGTIGLPKDDETNTFTARLLLLLESKPLCEADVYRQAVTQVINSYWRDFETHHHSFIPAFLVNDILRLWRTFCVNYEAASSSAQKRNSPKRKLKNYKLKHSRILTCFSSILYCQATLGEKGTMISEDALAMIQLSPLERLEACAQMAARQDVKAKISACLETYDSFLKVTNDQPEKLLRRFSDERQTADLFADASRFGDLIAEAVALLDGNPRLRRIVTV